jgi:hypothetical protein
VKTLRLSDAQFVHLMRLVFSATEYPLKDYDTHMAVQSAVLEAWAEGPPTCSVADALVPTACCDAGPRPLETEGDR